MRTRGDGGDGWLQGGGACDAASLAAAVVIFMELGRDRFVEKLDYLTSPGWLTGADSRREAGYRRGGPIAVVTNRGVMKFHEITISFGALTGDLSSMVLCAFLRTIFAQWRAVFIPFIRCFNFLTQRPIGS